MEPNERQSDDHQKPEALVGVRALLENLSFLQDLEIQIADDPNRMEELISSVGRRDLLLPLITVDASIGEANVRRISEMMRIRRSNRADRILQAQRVIQEIIRDFEKSEAVHDASDGTIVMTLKQPAAIGRVRGWVLSTLVRLYRRVGRGTEHSERC